MPLLSLLKGEGERQRLQREEFSCIGSSGVTTVTPGSPGARCPSAYRQGLLRIVAKLCSSRHPRTSSGTWAVGPSVMALFREAALQGVHKVKTSKVHSLSSSWVWKGSALRRAAFYMHKEWFWPRRTTSGCVMGCQCAGPMLYCTARLPQVVGGTDGRDPGRLSMCTGRLRDSHLPTQCPGL